MKSAKPAKLTKKAKPADKPVLDAELMRLLIQLQMNLEDAQSALTRIAKLVTPPPKRIAKPKLGK